MKTLYAYCPSCKIQQRVDSFAGRTAYLKHANRNGERCKRSGETCYHKPRDWHAGMPTDQK